MPDPTGAWGGDESSELEDYPHHKAECVLYNSLSRVINESVHEWNLTFQEVIGILEKIKLDHYFYSFKDEDK